MTSYGPTQRLISIGRSVTISGRSPFAQGVVLLSAVVLMVALAPLLVLAVLVGLGVVGFTMARHWLTAQRRPNGMLDGRRNVRVRLPGSVPPEV